MHAFFSHNFLYLGGNMKKKDLEENIVLFASYLDYHMTHKEDLDIDELEHVYRELFDKVIQENRVLYAGYRLSVAASYIDRKDREVKNETA